MKLFKLPTPRPGAEEKKGSGLAFVSKLRRRLFQFSLDLHSGWFNPLGVGHWLRHLGAKDIARACPSTFALVPLTCIRNQLGALR